MSNGLPPTNTWVSVEPCSSPDDALTSSVDDITITGSPGAITSVANDQPIWAIMLNDGTSSSNFRIDRYVGGQFVDSPIVIANATGAVTLTIDPTAPLGIATKEYVDAHAGAETISFGSTGLTPASPTEGAIVVAGTLNVASGGTGVASLTANGVLIGNGTGAVGATAQGASGALLYGAGAAPPTWLPIGANGQVLTIAGGALSWATSAAGIVDAPNDGNYYSRHNQAWAVSPGGLTDAPSDGTLYARKSAAWVHPAHTDITDWIVTLAPYALTVNVPTGATSVPVMDGTAAAGTGTTWARVDHVHPTDTTRASVASIPVVATAVPLMDGTAAIGASGKWADGAHVHPSDTTRVGKAGDTMTGDLSLASASPQLALNANAGANARIIAGQTNGSSRWALFMGDGTAEGGSNTGSDFDLLSYTDAGAYLATPLKFARSNSAATMAGTLTTVGTVGVSGTGGFAIKPGSNGAMSGSGFNFNWTGGNLQAWVDATNVGNVAFTSDYRVKQNVADLPSMWERTKALRPVSYEHKDYTPEGLAPDQGDVEPRPLVVADGVERWGFIAHELQETLTPSAATGVKDEANLIQSPNPWTVIATLTRALQEAMARIEALEATHAG
jgi:hypothetical protein